MFCKLGIIYIVCIVVALDCVLDCDDDQTEFSSIHTLILPAGLSDPAALVSVILCVCFNVQAKPANYVPILPPLSSFNNGVNHLLQMARIAAVAGGAGAGGVPGSAGGAGAAGALFAPPRAAKKRKRSNSRKSASKRGRRG